ncbi:hypothetical protein TNCV_2546571 [Trichonephila clavipes]|nr:hypothetical protein TNCV_2546571 [Trichonephila clavipes]
MDLGKTQSFPFSNRPSSGAPTCFASCSNSPVAFLPASITMEAMRFFLVTSVNESLSLSLFEGALPLTIIPVREAPAREEEAGGHWETGFYEIRRPISEI